MSDSYQAIYDAVRSRISGGNVGEAVADVARSAFDISHAVAGVAQEISYTAILHSTPSAVYRPKISIDGNQWCALYGDDLQNGVCGFGDSPADAMRDFDKAWDTKLAKDRAQAGDGEQGGSK